MTVKLQNLAGWTLLLVGIAIIFWASYLSYNIFTAKTAVPEVFKMPGETKNLTPSPGKTPANQVELQKEMEKMVGEQLKELIPIETLPKFFNLISWSLFAGLLIFAGSQIASIGIKLIKK